MINFVTVVYNDDVDFLQTQAKSFDVYVDPNFVSSISVVVNDHQDVCDRIHTEWYGKHQHKVQIIPYQTYGHVNTLTGDRSGWEHQQLCKLLASANSNTTWSIALDSKTWFVQPISYQNFFSPVGKALALVTPVHQDHFQSAREFTEKFFEVNLTHLIFSGVPFTFHNQTVRDMITHCEKHTGQPFADFFMEILHEPVCIAEFYLYSGYVLSKYQSFNELYTRTFYHNRINISEHQQCMFDELLVQMRGEEVLTASIHKLALPMLSSAQMTVWREFLAEKHLI